MILDVAAIAVDVRGHHGQCGRHVILQPCDEVKERVGVAFLWADENVLASCPINDGMVDVHRTARFILDRFRHEGGKAIVAQGRLADQPLEIKHFVRQFDRITVQQVDLQLTSSAFLRDAVNFKPLGFCEIIDVVDHRAELIHRRHGIGLPRSRRTPRTASHRLDFLCGVQISRDQEKLHLGGDNRIPSLVVIQFHDSFQHISWTERHRHALAVKGVVDHLQCPIAGPGGGCGSAHVRAQDHVFFDKPFFACGLSPAPRDGLIKDAVGQVEIVLFREFGCRDRLAARDAR